MISIEEWWRAKPSRWAWIQKYRANCDELKTVNSFCYFADKCIFRSPVTCAYCLRRWRDAESKGLVC